MDQKILFDQYARKLTQNNYKLTSQRKIILNTFLKHPDKHFNAEELYQLVKEINPQLGLATVYRTLEIFCHLGITRQLDFEANYKRYELNLEGQHHHHLICLNCGKIIEFNDQALEEFEKNLETEYQFKIQEHRIKFYGLCQDCIQEI